MGYIWNINWFDSAWCTYSSQHGNYSGINFCIFGTRSDVDNASAEDVFLHNGIHPSRHPIFYTYWSHNECGRGHTEDF